MEEEKEKEEKEERRRRRQRLTKMTRMSRVSPGGAGGGCLERERQPTLASANTGNNHLLFFYFVSLHISRPQKKRNAGKVVLVERAVQRRVLGEQSCLIYFYFTAPNTACGEEGVEVEYYSTSSSTSATVSTVFGEQGA